MTTCCGTEHLWHVPLPREPLPGERCCCTRYVWVGDEMPPQDTVPPLPGHCGRCGKPWDDPNHRYVGGSWVCLA